MGLFIDIVCAMGFLVVAIGFGYVFVFILRG